MTNKRTRKAFVFPRKWPKSIWKRLPVVVHIILSLWRSPMPWRGKKKKRRSNKAWLTFGSQSGCGYGQGLPIRMWQHNNQHTSAWNDQQPSQSVKDWHKRKKNKCINNNTNNNHNNKQNKNVYTVKFKL